MTFFSINLLIIFSLIMCSCEQEQKDPPKEKLEMKYDKQGQLDSLNMDEALILSKRLDAITGSDSAINYTYQIQEQVRKNKKPISFTGFINDITKQDSSFIIKIYGKFAKHKCFGEIFLSADQFAELYKQLDLKSSRNKGCFVFRPTSIKSSSMLTIDSEVSDGETIEDATSSLTYDFHDVLLFFKGNLVDFYLYKKLLGDDK